MKDAALRKRIVTIAEHYGWDSQSTVAIEEMSELTKEICKKSRIRSKFIQTKDDLDEMETNQRVADMHIIEALADVQIMVWQLSYLLGEDAETWIRRTIEQKVIRQMDRMKKEGGEA